MLLEQDYFLNPWSLSVSTFSCRAELWALWGESWNWVVFESTSLFFQWFRQHIFVWNNIHSRKKKVLCGDLPMKEEGEIWTWQVCSLCFEQLTSRSPPGQPLLAHWLFFFLLLFSWELWAGSERVNFSILSRWLKEPLQTWRCGDNCEVNVFFPFGNSLGKWQQWDFPSTCTFPKVQCFYVRLHYL